MKSTIIGFVGGPYTGKTVAAFRTTLALKCAGASVEMAREFVKQWAYEGRSVSAADELHILGQQVREESVLLGRVKFIVSERPCLLSIPYTRLYAPTSIQQGVEAAVLGHYRNLKSLGHRYVHVVMQRDNSSYSQHGRWENKRMAQLIDDLTLQALGELGGEVWTSTRDTVVETIGWAVGRQYLNRASYG